MKLHKDSHTDHLSPELLAYVLERFADREEFFVESLELPAELAEGLTSALYGPEAGDPALADSQVSFARRPGRDGPSRIVQMPLRPTRLLTVIAGPHDGESCVLFTAHGGPVAPREVWEFWNEGDYFSMESIESQRFWAMHALSYEVLD